MQLGCAFVVQLSHISPLMYVGRCHGARVDTNLREKLSSFTMRVLGMTF